MLLMGFNGLFTKIDSDLEILLSYLDNLHEDFHFPPSWQKLDMYCDTVALAVSILLYILLICLCPHNFSFCILWHLLKLLKF